MSTYLDFRCCTCGEDAGMWLQARADSTNTEEFAKILALRKHVAALASVPILFEGEFGLLPNFFAKHQDHDVAVSNGYGQDLLPDGSWSETRFR